MQHQPNPTTCLCGRPSGLLDEYGRCERCVLDAAAQAITLSELEELVTEALDRGLTADQLRVALELSLRNGRGELRGANVARRPVETRERGIWEVHPSSAFLIDEERPNRLRWLRRASGQTLEELADQLDVKPTTVAVWEHGAPIPEEPLRRCSELFAVSGVFIEGREG